MKQVKNYLSLIKFSHTIFAMPFAMIGFVLGLKADASIFEQTEVWVTKLALVIVCMVTARSAAMAFNRYLDRSFDALNPRTAIREIPAGIISANSALWFTIVMSALFVFGAWLINPLCFYLSPVALLVILGYSFTKRFTALCHLVLGLGLSLAPIGAYLAVTGVFALLPILFSFAVLCWVSGFDIIYSLQDEVFDKSLQLHSIPAALGKQKALAVSRVLHVLSFSALLAAAFLSNWTWLYGIGLAGFGGMLVYQHSLVKPHDLSKVNIAFMTANGIASVVFAIFVILDQII
ncbi:MAG: putative 4-hydroxybenzoate polyprenyltransferase [Chitinophagaceae bacterium]|nr:putative 4-hydroxybenzoate polyprenyltransferase [Chitinophagaceae bacterium]